MVNTMSCQFVQESISGYLDNRLAQQERDSVALHLAVCGECAAFHGRLKALRETLRSLPPARVPKWLAIDLQVLASRELLRRRQTGSPSAMTQFWASRMKLLVDNLMRPMALPLAGGLASALFIFGTLMPTLGALHTPDHDRPTALLTEASVDNVADFGARSKSVDDTLIEIQIDSEGRMVDYYVLQGQMTSEIGNFLLFSTFTPATIFLQPTSGKIVIRRSQIVVKG
jgi:anti-sigma factor RsiW